MTIKALVLDLDGTLYSKDKVDAVDRACVPKTHAYLEKRGLLSKVPKRRMEQIDREMASGHVSSNIRKLSKRFNINYLRFNDYVNNHNPKDYGITTDRRLVRLLTRASTRYKLFIFTNAPKIWVKRAVRDIGLGKLVPFKHIVCLECMGKYLKPDRESYAAMLRVTKMKKADILLLDDLQVNIAEAKKLGIRSIRVVNTQKDKRNSIYSVLERLCRGVKRAA